MVRALIRIKEYNAAFALWFGGVLSWPVWLPLILAGSVFGWAIRQDDLVMLLLTIQTSVDAAATKMLQNHVRDKDEERDKRNDAILVELKQQAEASARRDKAAAKNTKMLIAAVTATNDLLTCIIERGLSDRRRGQAASSSRRRANRKK